MIRRIVREAAVFALYLAIAVAMTWPLARNLPTALADLGDPLFCTWILDWGCYALTHAPLHLYDAPMYYPGRLSLAYSENLAGISLLVWPFHLAGASPITVYNIAMLLGFALSGYGMFVLARLITKSTGGAIVAGVLFAFVPFKFDHLSHLQLIWSGWLPLLLAAVIAYWRDPRPKLAACITAAFVMNGLTNVHYFLFGSLTAALTIVAFLVLDPRRGRRFWLTLVAAFIIGGILLTPFLLPYRIVANEYGMVRSQGEAISGSAPAYAWLVTNPRIVLYGKLGPAEWHRHEMQLFPGLVALILATIGMFCHPERSEGPGRVGHESHASRPTRPGPSLTLGMTVLAIATWLGIITDRIEWTLFGQRILSFDSADVPATLLVILLVIRYRHVRSQQPERWAAALWILVGVVGSFGMNAFFHAFLYRRLGFVFAAIRAPVRWAIIAYIGLAVFAAFGVVALQRKRVPAALLAAILIIDMWPAPRWEQAVPTPAPVYRWLDRAQVAPFIELPMANGSEFSYLLGSMHHHLPQFNGMSPFSAPLHAKLRAKNDASQFDDELLSLLEQNGCKLVIVHVHALGDMSNAVRAWLMKGSGRLEYLRSFDHEVGGDFVFGVTRNYRGTKDPNVPDGAGHLPQQKLARMLAGEPTHSDAIQTVIESPGYGELVRGPLRIKGWTLSPFRITRVTALLDVGTKRIDVPLVDERPDLKQKFSWYYFVARPGFELTIPERPRGVGRSTDVQIEVEDESGRVMRSSDVVFDWERTP